MNLDKKYYRHCSAFNCFYKHLTNEQSLSETMVWTWEWCNLKLCICLFQIRLEGYEFPVYSTDSCPDNEREWKERSTAINCTKNNGYMCFPNEDITGLLEFCYIYTQLLITKGNWKKCIHMY